jgi:hypothetical protein
MFESHGVQHLSSVKAGLSRVELLRWYFEDRLGRPVPADLERYWRLAGFTDESSFERAILREYWYAHRQPIA